MFVIEQESKKIIITRGDTASMLVTVKTIDGSDYPLAAGDIITLTVRKTPDSEIAIQKVADENQYITIFPEDTSSLNTGLYVYDCQLREGDNIYTIVPMSFFELRSEVTYGD